MDARQARFRAIAEICAGVSLFAVVDGLSKVLVDTLSFGQIMFARYALALPVLFLVTDRAGRRGLLRTGHPVLQTLRALSPFVIGGAMVIGVGGMPLADATVLLFAGPFLVVALSGLLLGERVGGASWAAVALGFVAVLMVARPGTGTFSPYAVFPLAAAVFYAGFQLMSRRLATLGEASATTLAWTLGIGLVLSAPLALWEWRSPDAAGWALGAALALAFAFAHLLIVRAYDRAPANVLAPFSYVQIAAATLFGIAAFGAVPDLLTLAGVALIAAAGVLVVRTGRG
jgi:drug/metabolite transporter (DMT)-like permease